MLAVACAYAGLAAMLVGLAALIHPLRLLAIPSRPVGAAVLAAGALLVAIGWSLPAPEVRVAARRTLLDRYVPVYQFHEVHAVRVAAPPAVAWRAVNEVTAGEIRLFRTLTTIRRLGRPGRRAS